MDSGSLKTNCKAGKQLEKLVDGNNLFLYTIVEIKGSLEDRTYLTVKPLGEEHI